MPSTHFSLHYHLVFSTKNRLPHIQKEWRERLHAYLGGIIRDQGGVPHMIGGVEDHVHLLIGLRTTHRLPDLLREVKASSSNWVHRELRRPAFSWQEGYGVFTVGAPQIEAVKNYIANQEERHRRTTFQEEYLSFLKQGGIAFDERYLW
ncbi:MAG: IS200/IS605 family transposase [Blastocatellia bacterium]